MSTYLKTYEALLVASNCFGFGCSHWLNGLLYNSSGSLSGDYRQDTLSVVNTLKTALDLPEDDPEKAQSQSLAREKINEFSARYQRDTSVAALNSFTTMRTALNSLAGHYSSYPNRPVPQKLKQRLQQEFKQVENSLSRGG